MEGKISERNFELRLGTSKGHTHHVKNALPNEVRVIKNLMFNFINYMFNFFYSFLFNFWKNFRNWNKLLF